MKERDEFLEHKPCPYPDCRSSDALAVYKKGDGSLYGYCFSCKRFTDYKNNTVEEADIEQQEQIIDVAHLPMMPDISRKLEQWAMEYFGVRSELSQQDGTTPTAHYYPYTKDGVISGYKVRKISPKGFWVNGDIRDCQLFGQKQAQATASKKLFITEGELDCVTLWQELKKHSKGTQWEGLQPAVVSVALGAAAAVKSLAQNLAFVKSFGQIILCFDQDEAGKTAVSEILSLLPEALVVTLPEKDANEMLLKGKGEQLAKLALFSAQKIRPASIVTVQDVFERAIAKPTMGLSFPWPTLNKSTYGFHRKKIYGWGGGVGLGKTELAKELQAHIIDAHHLPIGAFELEEDVAKTLKSLAGKRRNKIYYQPDLEFPQEEINQAIKDLEGKVFLYDHKGVKDWDDIKTAIRYLVVAENVRDIFIDPITALVAHLSSSEANDCLNSIFGEMSGMVHELDCTIHYFAHLNLPTSGPPHEMGGEALESQLTGSRAQMKWSDYIIMIQGNKSPELDPYERNTRYVVVRKDRPFGRVCKFPIFFNPITGRLLEPNAGGMY